MTQPKPPDENDRHRAGTLPADPGDDADDLRRADDPPPFDGPDFAPTEDAGAGGEPEQATGGGIVHLADAIGPAFERFQRRAAGTEKAIPLPWDGLTEAMGGGLRPGVVLLVGNTGTFKTAVALEIAAHAAASAVPVLYVGLELGTDDLVARLAGLVAKVPWSKIWNGDTVATGGRFGSNHAVDSVTMDDRAELARWPFHFEVAPPMGWSYERIKAGAAAMRASYRLEDDANGKPIRGSRPILLVLDFLQIIGPSAGQREDLRERIGRASYAARAVARELDATVILVSSTSRDNYGTLTGRDKEGNILGSPAWTRPAPLFVGLGKESGETEYSADAVWVLFSEHVEKGQPIPLHLAVAKRRAGPPGWTSLRVDPYKLKVRDMTQPERTAWEAARSGADTSGNAGKASKASAASKADPAELTRGIKAGKRDGELEQLKGHPDASVRDAATDRQVKADALKGSGT